MSDEVDIALAKIQAITQARLELGQRGQALSTRKSLGFALDHAKAQAAVHSHLERSTIQSQLTDEGIPTRSVSSAATSRDAYIKRPDLGRILSKGQVQELPKAGYDIALVLGDGLSAIAANLNGPSFVKGLWDALDELGLKSAPVVLAEHCRVALGDQIANAMNAEIAIVALGERPGLSAADSLGVYVTYEPSERTQDSARNCISNIREAGLPVGEAIAQTVALVAAMRSQKRSGVGLEVPAMSKRIDG
ncbi:MAG: ethanolamine ammonia-lyase subunit EutC [Pseudomonadota bacterium]